MLQGIFKRKPTFPSMLLITAETRYMKHIVTHFLSVAKNVCEVRKCRDIAQRNDLLYQPHDSFINQERKKDD